jgi:hypothetical protein
MRPSSQSHITRAESCTRQAQLRYRSWRRITSGVWLSVIGAAQYGTTNVFYTIVRHVDAQELRPSIHSVMATFRTTEPEVVRVVDRRGIQRAHTLDTTLDHARGQLRFMAYRPGVDTTSTLLKAVGG